MQPEIHVTEPPVPAPAGDLVPPRRTKGVPRVTVILGVGLLAAATFLAGIEAQKQWGGSSSSRRQRGDFAAFAAANGGAAHGRRRHGHAGRRSGGRAASSAAAAVASRAGTVKLVQGSTIYVTTTDGNTVKVTVPASAAITKSVTEKVSGIQPGDTVTAIGTTSNGVVKAATVRIGESRPGRLRPPGRRQRRHPAVALIA